MDEEFREEPLEEEDEDQEEFEKEGFPEDVEEELEEELEDIREELEEEESIEELEEEHYGLPEDVEDELEDELEDIREDLEEEEKEFSDEEKEILEEELLEDELDEEEVIKDIVEDLKPEEEEEEEEDYIASLKKGISVEPESKELPYSTDEKDQIDKLEPYVETELPEPAELYGPEGEPHPGDEPDRKPLIEEIPEVDVKTGGQIQLILGDVQGDLIPYGYDLVKDKLIINQEEAMKVKVVYSWFYKLDKSIEEIFGATRLKIEIIEKVLSNPIYFGKIFFQGAFVDSNHEPILNERYCQLNDINIEEVKEKFLASLK